MNEHRCESMARRGSGRSRCTAPWKHIVTVTVDYGPDEQQGMRLAHLCGHHKNAVERGVRVQRLASGGTMMLLKGMPV